MRGGGKHKISNSLLRVRKRRGLKQKQVAYLLGNETSDQVSRHETGAQLPQLEAALKLEVIFGVPVRLLFRELSERAAKEVRERAQADVGLRNALPNLFSDGLCSYAELLEMPSYSHGDIEQAANHTRVLMHRIADLNKGAPGLSDPESGSPTNPNPESWTTNL